MMLTDEQAQMLSGLPDREAYNLFWSLWGHVIDASIDAGTDYEGIGCDVSLVQEKAI